MVIADGRESDSTHELLDFPIGTIERPRMASEIPKGTLHVFIMRA